MSSMTKFLKQTCKVEKALRDNKGKVLLTTYGDVRYQQAQTVKCRKEKYAVDVQSSNGAIIKTQTRFFLDESLEILVDDRIDGLVVLRCEEYIDQFGVCIGYEAYA